MAEQDEQYEETVEINTLLGRGSAFEGKLTFEGAVRIDGEFSGEIFSDDILVVGEAGIVRAELEIGSLVIEGAVEGNIRAKRSVEIHAPGRVTGNIVTPSLFIDRGVVFEGNCQMVKATGETQALHPPRDEVVTAESAGEDDQDIADISAVGSLERSGTIES